MQFFTLFYFVFIEITSATPTSPTVRKNTVFYDSEAGWYNSITTRFIKLTLTE